MTDIKRPSTYKHLTVENRIEILADCSKASHSAASPSGQARITRLFQGSKKAHTGHSCPDRKLWDPLESSFVCNGWWVKWNRNLEKHEYLARFAHQAYRETLVESRSGNALSKESFYEIDRIITEGINKGRHLHHINKTQKLSVFKSTF